jgi:hypothetical protein
MLKALEKIRALMRGEGQNRTVQHVNSTTSEPNKSLFQIPVDSLLLRTQRYTGLRQTNCSLLLTSYERSRIAFLPHLEPEAVSEQVRRRMRSEAFDPEDVTRHGCKRDGMRLP